MLSIREYYNTPSLFFRGLIKRCNYLFPDRLYLRLLYRIEFGKKLNLNSPQSFSEKLQWLKLYNRRSEYTTMVDKYAVKDYVARMIGEEHIIPTLGVWDKPEDIDWDSLPNQFVLKTTHGGGGTGVVICKDKQVFDRGLAIKKLKRSMQANIYGSLREWPYKDVPKRVIAERYMSDGDGDLNDYKVHCFNGIPRVILLCRDRFGNTGMTEDFYTDQWEHMDVKRPNHDNPNEHKKPAELEEMLALSRRLSEGIPFVRVDFYTIGNKVYFGELTFFPASGLAHFEPSCYDDLFGSWLKIEA